MRGIRRGVIVLALAGGLLPSARLAVAQQPPVRLPLRPNLLLVVTDDQRLGTMEVMPATVRNFNVGFTRAFVTTPVCCPARASFLTGQYAHNTGVLTNDENHYSNFEQRAGDSLGPWLQASGYYTGFVGRYFNKFEVSHPAPPGWDEFYGYNGDGPPVQRNDGGFGYLRFDLKELWMDAFGETHEEVVAYRGRYSTDVFADKALSFIERAASATYNPDGKPWALLVWPKAPHLPATPERKYQSAPVPRWDRPPSFFEDDMSDKPPEVRHSPYREKGKGYHFWLRKRQLRTLMSVDDMVKRIFGSIRDLSMEHRTWGIYTSDNGFFWGEHGSKGKVYGYEESVGVPFRMAVPVVPGTETDALVANVDVAPTFMELAGDDSSHDFDGHSLVRLALGLESEVREEVLIEAFGEGRDTSWIHYDGLRTDRWKYIRWVSSGNEELYDLHRDRYELDNVAARHPQIAEQLRQRVDELKN